MASFAAASTAVHAAAAIQADVAEHGAGIVVRVGVAVGDVTREGDDYFGLPVVAAARLEAAAEGGQILVTESVRLLAGDRAGDRYEPRGQLKLKGIADPVVAYAVDWDRPPATGRRRCQVGAAFASARARRLRPPPLRRPRRGRRRPPAGLGRWSPGARADRAHRRRGGCRQDPAGVGVRPRGARAGGVGAVRRVRRRPRPAVPALGAGGRPTADRDAEVQSGGRRHRRTGAARSAAHARRVARRPTVEGHGRSGCRALPHLRGVRRPARRSGPQRTRARRPRRSALGRTADPRPAAASRSRRAPERGPRRRYVPRHGRRGHRVAVELPGRPPARRGRDPHAPVRPRRRRGRALRRRDRRPRARRRPPPDRGGADRSQRGQRVLPLRAVAAPQRVTGRRPRRWPLGGEPGAGNCRARQRARRRQCPPRRLVTLRPAGHRPRRPVWPTDRPARPRAGRRPGAGRARCRGRRARGGRAARRHRRRGADPPVRALHRAGHRRGRDRRPATGPTASRPGPRDRDRLRGRPPSGARRSGAPLRRRHSHRPARQGRLLRPPGRGPGDAGGGVRRSRCPPRGRARPDDSVGRAGRGARRDGHRRAAPSVVQDEPGGVPGGVRDRHRARRRGGGGRRRGGFRDGDALPRSARRPGGGHAPPRPGHDRRRRVGRPGPGDGHARAGPGVRRALGGGVGDGGVRGRPGPGRR